MVKTRFITKGKGAGKKVIPLRSMAISQGKKNIFSKDTTAKELRIFVKSKVVTQGRKAGMSYSSFDKDEQVTLMSMGVTPFSYVSVVTDDMFQAKLHRLVDMFWSDSHSAFKDAYDMYIERLPISDNAKEWFKEDTVLQGNFEEGARDTYDIEQDIIDHFPEMKKVSMQLKK
ncbi:hypothetical protein GQ472_01685 [archaeon]|nr:hypothetical protein [archaeon]